MCDVCELVAFSVYFDTMEKLKVRHQSAFSEDDIIQTISDVCDRKRKAGEWMWTVDLTEKLSSLKGSRYWNEPNAVIGDKVREDYEFVEIDHRVVQAEQMQQNMADMGNPMAMHTPLEMEEILLEDMEERGMSEDEIEAYIHEEEDKYDQQMGTNIRAERHQKKEKQKTCGRQEE
ncbi:hypothetical protein JL722_3678 [Aureococcus anophagefferens]|nr:hypothetical protein JL722_3678 [Aureococcus anophagefferens]